MQPHESGALFGHAQRDAQRERAPRQAAHARESTARSTSARRQLQEGVAGSSGVN